jgi:hypothetical protein
MPETALSPSYATSKKTQSFPPTALAIQRFLLQFTLPKVGLQIEANPEK